MTDQERLLEALAAIPCSELNYSEWAQVGMALKQEGFDCAVWEDWSRADHRYHAGECEKKWHSFRGTGNPVTGGTIVELAKRFGYRSSGGMGQEIGWDDEISAEKEDGVVVNKDWIEGKDLPKPMGTPVQQIITYLETLFDGTEYVGYVTETWDNNGKHSPQKGNYDRTAGQLLEALYRCDGDIGAVFGDYDPSVGVWIRFNPLDAQGVRNDNVTRWDYALVESDEMPVEEQYAVYQQMELPIRCLVHSGGKSLHAIVRVDAPNYTEYQRRVDYLYHICQKNGLKIDRQNRNPSRLSRMPGVMRNGKQQSLLAVNLGKQSWEEWKEWIEAVNDDLPDTESLDGLWDDLPELSPPLIENVLRQGHKLLLAGPSKAGKSFSLIELTISIAEGRPWLGFNCAKGKVLYVNLELDRASCLHRFKDVYNAMGVPARNLDNISIWNLRGRSVPMDKLAPKLIRRAAKQNFLAVIIDPIYKVITGDENSADQMAAFCNQFDKVCTELGCAVIYCHHHSKGAQGGKRSMDRASGSGVFARDPDALLDMIQLELNEDVKKQRKNNAVTALCGEYLERHDMNDKVSQDDLCSRKAALEACMDYLPTAVYNELMEKVDAADAKENAVTGWRIEGTLREFPSFPALNVWFEYPVHRVDSSGVLADIQPEEAAPAWKKNLSKSGKRAGTKTDRRQERRNAIENAFQFSLPEKGEEVAISTLAEYMGVSEKTVRNHLKEHGGFYIDENMVGMKAQGKKE